MVLQAPSHACWQRPQRSRGRTVLVGAQAVASRAQSDVMSLVFWAVKNNVQFAKIKPAIQPGSGRGLVATADIQAGDCICSVPVTAAIRVFPGCPAVLQVPQNLWQQLPWYGQLALTLLSEQHKGPASKWHDYIKQLPDAVAVPALWGEAAVQQLRCGYFVEQVHQQQADWTALQQQVSPYLAAAGISTDRLLWALSITRSRTFAAPYSSTPLGSLFSKQSGQQQQQQHVMCPLLDLLNHRGDVQSECEFYSDFRSSVFRVVASQPWPRGQQVFISYGSGSNDTLLQLYGFVEANNRDDRFIVRSLPAVLTQLGCAGVDRDAALSEVVFTRQGLEPADAARLSQLVQESSGARTRPGGSRPQGGSNASTSVVPFAELSQPVRSACAAAVQQEVAALAVDAAADQEVLQAWDQEPLKQAELAAKQQDLSKAQGRLAQLQHLQAQEAQQAEVAAAAAEHPVGKQQVQQQAAAEGQQQPRPQQSQGTDAPAADAVEAAHAAAAAASVQEELLATLRMCQELCTSLAAEVHELEQLLARWQQLMQRHQQLAVMFRSEKHKLLVEVLEQLA